MRGCEDGQERKIELSLERAEIGEAIETALHRRIDALRALREEREQIRMGYLAIIKEEALKIDPETAGIVWANGDPLDPYALGPQSPFNLADPLCFVHSPGKTSCVWIGDLPIETREALRLKRPKLSDASAGPQCAVTNPSDRPKWMSA